MFLKVLKRRKKAVKEERLAFEGTETEDEGIQRRETCF